MEQESEDHTHLTPETIKAELEVLKTRTKRQHDQLQNQRKFITSELEAQGDIVTDLIEKNHLLTSKVKTLTKKVKVQEQQISGITTQVHHLTNQVDLLMARLRHQEQQEHQEQQAEHQQAQEEQVGNIVQE